MNLCRVLHQVYVFIHLVQAIFLDDSESTLESRHARTVRLVACRWTVLGYSSALIIQSWFLFALDHWRPRVLRVIARFVHIYI